MNYDLVVIGGGAAGISGAISAYDAGLKNILIIDREDNMGGVLNELIESGYGYMENGLTGVEVAENLKKEILKRDIDVKLNTLVLDVYKDKTIKIVSGTEGVKEINAKSIIFATGAREKPRGQLNISYSSSAGIMSVASSRKLIVNDGYLPGKEVIIYGLDVNSIYLSKMLVIEGAKNITIVEPSKESKNKSNYLDDILGYENIKILYNTKITQIIQNGRIVGVKIKDNNSNEKILDCDSLILSVGLDSSKRLFKKFRRNRAENGLFVVGNAEKIRYDLEFIVSQGKEAGIMAKDYIASLN
ncbi:MAG: FAD-dependent oxidoreductase [Clostridium sp.]|nr:FAD-dependent oxidoreductase [Clostridium sp.]